MVLSSSKKPPGSHEMHEEAYRVTVKEVERGWLVRLTPEEKACLEWVVPRFIIHQGFEIDTETGELKPKLRVIDDARETN